MILERLFPATVMPDQDWWHTLWPDSDHVVKSLRIKDGMKVVDSGCGDSYFTAAIARQLGSGHVIGFDLDPAMLAQAKETSHGMTNCDWLLGDSMELCRLIEPPVNYVLIANTFHGVPDKTGLARVIATILQPTGQFAIVNWTRSHGNKRRYWGNHAGHAPSFACHPGRHRHWSNRLALNWKHWLSCLHTTMVQFSEKQRIHLNISIESARQQSNSTPNSSFSLRKQGQAIYGDISRSDGLFELNTDVYRLITQSTSGLS